MVTETKITGRVLMDDVPASNQDVLLVSEGMDQLLDAAQTGQDGEFHFAVEHEGPGASVHLLAKVKGRYQSLLYRRVQLPQQRSLELQIGADEDVFLLRGTVKSDAGMPPFLNVFLDPVEVAGVPAQLERFFNQKEEGVLDAHFGHIRVDGGAFEIRVKPGSYRIGGEYINYDRPMMVQPEFYNYIVHTATKEEASIELPGNPYSGFELQVTADCRVELTLRVVEDEEL